MYSVLVLAVLFIIFNFMELLYFSSFCTLDFISLVRTISSIILNMYECGASYSEKGDYVYIKGPIESFQSKRCTKELQEMLY